MLDHTAGAVVLAVGTFTRTLTILTALSCCGMAHWRTVFAHATVGGVATTANGEICKRSLSGTNRVGSTTPLFVAQWIPLTETDSIDRTAFAVAALER
ncbi:MAG: hypothetical protein R2839_09275 [Thermomicrobiales bacterium]